MRRFKAAVIALLATLALAACDGTGTATRTATSDMDANRPLAKTWEQAAIAEAARLNPELTDPRADRVLVPPPHERMRVRAAGGYCHIFGGKHDRRVGWQANDLGAC